MLQQCSVDPESGYLEHSQAGGGWRTCCNSAQWTLNLAILNILRLVEAGEADQASLEVVCKQ